MNRRRSLFVIGCLVAAFVAFASDAAFAQNAAPTVEFTADERGHDTVRLTWEHPGTDLDEFSLRYQQNTPADDQAPIVVVAGDFSATMNTMRMDVDKASSGDDYTLSIDGLKPNKDYVFGLTALGTAGNGDADEVFAHAKTDTADEPDDVTDLMLYAGDSMILAMWDEATDNGSPVTGYTVQYREEGKSSWMESRDGESGTDTSTEWTISNLKNGTTYEARVQACSFTMCGDWTDEEEAMPMSGAVIPTPALPLFGALALGAGLVAAGRQRLRRRQRLLNS